jgi:hypothetical protein
VRAKGRRERAQRDRRLEKPAIDVLTALGERDATIAATEHDIYWLVPTEDAWRSGDRTVQCAAFYPGIYRLTGSLRGTRQ